MKLLQLKFIEDALTEKQLDQITGGIEGCNSKSGGCDSYRGFCGQLEYCVTFNYKPTTIRPGTGTTPPTGIIQ